MNTFFNKQAGFTLVEVLVVMLILVAMASVTVETTSELAFQNRWEVTKDRYNKLKQAIIGRPDVLINGQPDISGFVADMGRLPNNIRELLDQDYCSADRTLDNDGVSFDTGTYASAALHCNGVYGANSWIIQNNWNGPYLTITKGLTDPSAFPDGWGNLPTAYCTDLNFIDELNCTGAGETWFTDLENHNYGWYHFIDTSGAIDELHIFSLGKDRLLGGVAPDYDADYPSSLNHPNEAPVVNFTEWMIQVPQLTIAMQSPVQNDFNCTTNGIEENACASTSNWKWFGKPECRTSSNVLTSHVTPSTCTAASNTWYWLTGWPAGTQFCAGGTSTGNEATATDCAAVSGDWITKGLCSSGSSTGSESTLVECLNVLPTPGEWRLGWCGGGTSTGDELNSSACSSVSGTWYTEWSIKGPRCLNRFFTTQLTCESAGHRWIVPFCTNPAKTTKATCSLANESWVISFCSESGISTNDASYTESSCTTAGGMWGGCFGQTNSKYFCDINGGSWITNTQNIEVELTFTDGAGGTLTATANASLEENGLNQNIVFDNDDEGDGVVFFIDTDLDGFEDVGEADVTAIPQGLATFNVFKAGTADVYPPSCSGLTAAQCVAADGGDPDAVLLNNNLCDNVTATECTNAGGQLLRNTKSMFAIPNKTIPINNW